MKKAAVLVLFLLLYSSCQTNSTTDLSSIKGSLNYFMDTRTGLCFASINSVTKDGWEVTSITCVPCDSLRKYEIRDINK